MTDGPARALLVIDVQREYVDGALPIAWPPLSVSLPNIESAVAAAHDAGVPVVLVRHVDAEDSPVFAAGSRGAELHETVAAADHDLLLEKDTVSCFGTPRLAAWLEERRGSGRDLCFVLGGPSGTTVPADEALSFGAPTLPFQLARVVLLEQLYRAHKILAREPYHY